MKRREFIRSSIGTGGLVLGAGLGGAVSGATFVSQTRTTQAANACPSTPTLPPTTVKPFVGTCASPNSTYKTNTLSEFYRLQGDFGRTFEVRRTYDTTLPETFAKSVAADDVGKRASVWSFKYDPEQIQSGAVDGKLHAFFQSVPLEHRDRLYVCYYHEPENDDFAPADFAMASKRIHDIAVQYKNERGSIKAGIILMHWSFTTQSGRNPDHWWPGDGHCDFVGIDVYPLGNYTSVSKRMKVVTDWCKAKKVPFGIAEMGTQPEDKNYTATKAADWIRSFITWSQQEQPLFLTYFHSYVGGNFWLDDQPEVLEAYRAMYDSL